MAVRMKVDAVMCDVCTLEKEGFLDVMPPGLPVLHIPPMPLCLVPGLE